MLFVVVEKGIKVKMDIKEKLVELLGKMISPTMTIREQADFLISNEVTVVRHGQWIADGDGYHWTYNCSICAWEDGYPFNERHNFCPNCGAKMDERNE